jgi:hypothetical protein
VVSESGLDRSIREAVGYFETVEALEAAIDELESSGFDRAEISVLASEQTVDEKLGHSYRKVSELEDDPTVPRTFYVSRESVGDAEGTLIGGSLYLAAVTAAGAIVASGGTLAAAIAGAIAAGGAGSVLGAVLAKRVGDSHARYLQQQLAHGGLVLWVRTWQGEDEERAVAILKKCSGRDVHVHDIPISG